MSVGSNNNQTKGTTTEEEEDKKRYVSGGLVDYTGPAWVDGTKSRPEAFLSAIDTENIRDLTKAMLTVDIPSWITPHSDMFTGNNTSIGDIIININEAEIANDMDIEHLAKEIGSQFTKELGKMGYDTRRYSF
jgi:hypothetical protein